MYYNIALLSWLITWYYIQYGKSFIEGVTVEEAAQALYTLTGGGIALN